MIGRRIDTPVTTAPATDAHHAKPPGPVTPVTLGDGGGRRAALLLAGGAGTVSLLGYAAGVPWLVAASPALLLPDWWRQPVRAAHRVALGELFKRSPGCRSSARGLRGRVRLHPAGTSTGTCSSQPSRPVPWLSARRVELGETEQAVALKSLSRCHSLPKAHSHSGAYEQGGAAHSSPQRRASNGGCGS
jgi:hypothetical protein